MINSTFRSEHLRHFSDLEVAVKQSVTVHSGKEKMKE
jgi:hypothetical protein